MSKRKVLISPGFGAGWSTWNSDYRNDFIFDVKLIGAIEAGDNLDAAIADFDARMKEKHGYNFHGYYGGATNLQVRIVTGKFVIDEYDGSEYILSRNDIDWL